MAKNWWHSAPARWASRTRSWRRSRWSRPQRNSGTTARSKPRGGRHQNPLSKQDLDSADIIIEAVAITPENNERFENYDVYEIP